MPDGPARGAQPAAGIRTSTSSAGTVLAFDFGTRWTGVAVGEHESRIAHPLTVIESRTTAGRLAAIAPLVGTWHPTHLVVGLPLTLSGEEHRLSGAVRRFGAGLGERFGLPVVFVDERLSSADASDALRASGRAGRAHKHLLHPLAAQRILHDYFGGGAAP